MASINSVTLMGNLGNDPELGTGKNGRAWCRFSLATNQSHRNENGEKISTTTWHRVKVFGKSAESCHTYLKKGRMAFIEGRIHNYKFTKEDGSDAYGSEVVAHKVDFLGDRRAVDLETEKSANEIPF
jgi:single-strand DNA-binding protein